MTGARAGAYTVVGEINERADLRSDDGVYRFYWGSPAPALETRRRLLGEDSGAIPVYGDNAVSSSSILNSKTQHSKSTCLRISYNIFV